MAALEAIGGKSSHLVPHLVANRLGDPRQIAIAAAHEFGVPLLDLDAVELDLDIVKLVNDKLLHQASRPAAAAARQAPVRRRVPTRPTCRRSTRSSSRPALRIEAVVVEEDKLDAARRARDRAGRHDDAELGRRGRLRPRESRNHRPATRKSAERGIERDDVDDAPIVRFVNKVMLDAIKRGASDIHFEPYEKHLPDSPAHRRRAERGRAPAGRSWR